MNANGFHFIASRDSTAFFDFTGDGVRERTGWVSGRDGFLAYDANQDGVIADRDEIRFKGYLAGARTDLEGLAAFDTNHDGKLSAADAKWNQFYVWQDANEDGFQTAGELLSLGQRGIASIGLASDHVTEVSEGNTVHGLGTYTRTDGSTGLLADVQFAVSTEQLDAEPDDEITAAASGGVANLGAGNDTFRGGDAVDTVYGGTGDDRIAGEAGNDVIFGDAGADLVLGGSGNDQVSGGRDDDALDGGAGDDLVRGNQGDDRLYGNAGQDRLLGDEGNDVIYGNEGDDQIFGGSGQDFMAGGLGNDFLHGGTGADKAFGGEGNDVYFLDDRFDEVTELAGEGVDSVVAFANVQATAHVENYFLGGTDSLEATGDGGDNRLFGNRGDNYIDGGTGADLLWGGAGDDVYVVDNALDQVVELADGYAATSSDMFDASNLPVAGTFNSLGHAGFTGTLWGNDTVKASINYTLGVNVENLILTGAATDATGNAQANVLVGTQAANRLDGAGGADRLVGGQGDDRYIVDSSDDIIEENAGEGLDHVEASATYVLASHVENLTLTGADDIGGTGNAQANTLAGNTGHNRLDGAGGADVMIGGAGDDTYTVDSLGDRVTELAGEGTDTVETTLDYALGANVENLVLTGASDVSGTGNMQDNLLRGNAGHNLLDGAAGADGMAGGAGDDTYVVDDVGDQALESEGEGTDTVRSSVTFTLGAHVENLSLTGSAGVNGVGNAQANVLAGNASANRLDGGAGADAMAGGAGNDSYVVDDAGDVVTELAGEGADGVESSISYTLAANVENLQLTGTGTIDGTGNALNNALAGNQADNRLDGGAGDDVLVGGAGNDTYVVDGADQVVEFAGEGEDTVLASASHTLADQVENLVLTGGADLNGAGNALANDITGNVGDNWLDGRAGADTLRGGAGDDQYVVDDAGDQVLESDGEGTDTVLSSVTFTLGAHVENLVLTGSADIDGTGNGLANTLRGNAGANRLAGGQGNDTYVVTDARDTVVEAQGEGVDEVLATISYTLTDQVENLTLTGMAAIDGTGNALANHIVGNAAANRLDGGAGADRMAGGAGHDTYIVDNTGDTVEERAGEGIDTVRTSVTYTLSANTENIVLTGSADIDAHGNDLANELSGNDGINRLAGGRGNDVYTITDARDTIVELEGEGTDQVRTSVSYTLADHIEQLVLTGSGAINGTGNSQANVIVGNGAANTLDGRDGNDVLDGGAGADRLVGGKGNDVMVVDNAADTTVELAGEGTDQVTASLSWTLGANIENLLLAGTAAIDGTGNELANLIVGNDAANRLDGKAGADRLQGGKGDDTYLLDNTGDTVVEAAGEGTDHALSAVTTTLSANVEHLTLTGTAAVNGTGNGLDNRLVGNAAANTLTGGQGKDHLDGGAGADKLLGGEGDDTYIVDSQGDAVTENVNQGRDHVRASVTYTLTAHVEDLTLTGSANIDGTGNALDNALAGNAGRNELRGGDGNDRLDGGAGEDHMKGGRGHDVYIADHRGDRLDEDRNEGTDRVESSVTWTLDDHFENLTLTGTAAIDGTGNDLANVIQGNLAGNTLRGQDGNDRLTGGDGHDVLDGGDGADAMAAGKGNDTYVVDDTQDTTAETENEGHDTVRSSVTWTLGEHFEDIVLTGNAAVSATGNTLHNRLSGNDRNNTLEGREGNDVLDGGGGVDRLVGGLGDDDYVVDDSRDVVVEAAGEGLDRVFALDDYTLSAHLEELSLLGNGHLDGIGNGADNRLSGNAGRNTLRGMDGDDMIDGRAGADDMHGGRGDDTFIVDNSSDKAIEAAGAGTDLVISSVSYVLGDHVENIRLSGSAGLDATGNDSANELTGNAGNNGLDGGGGADRMAGGAGDDSYGVDHEDDLVTEAAGEGVDTVFARVSYTLTANVENLLLAGNANLEGRGNALDNVLTGNDGRNRLYGGQGNDVYVINGLEDRTIELAGAGTDTVQASVSHMLGAYVENLTLLGTANLNGTGNDLDNVMRGNTGRNTMDGGAGNDTLLGNAGADNLSGGEGNDLLDGGAGGDRLAGGAGGDTYVVRQVADTVVELAHEGVDTVNAWVSYTLAAHVENLNLVGPGDLDGTGNALANTLVGNASANVLDGGRGIDRLEGRGGDDTYVVADAGDVVVEARQEGTDTVQASVTATLAANVENLVLTGSGDIDGTGNELANRLEGNAGLNRLAGGAGDDTYLVGTGDTVVEYAGGGNDTVLSHGSFTLGAHTENLVLVGEASVNATGNGEANVLAGNRGINTLDGGAGDDRLLIEGESFWGRQHGAQNSASQGSRDWGRIVSLDGKVRSRDTFKGGSGVDTLAGTAGDDGIVLYDGQLRLAGIEVIDAGAGDDIVDLTNSDATYGNVMVLGGSGDDIVWANGDRDVLQAGAGADWLDGGAGNNLLDGGAGNDRISDGEDSSVVIGGRGTDDIDTGEGVDVIAFNRGDGADSVRLPDAAAGDVVSLGGGIRYAQLRLRKSGADLVLDAGDGDRITFEDWYSRPAAARVSRLQIVTLGGDHDASSTDRLVNRQVQVFDFARLVSRFDAARAQQSAATNGWAVMNSLLDAHLKGTDTQALGGDLAFQYASGGSLTGIGLQSAQDSLSGGANLQLLRSRSDLEQGSARLA